MSLSGTNNFNSKESGVDLDPPEHTNFRKGPGQGSLNALSPGKQQNGKIGSLRIATNLSAPNFTRQVSGFTLLEILVVIGLIALVFLSVGSGLGLFTNFKEKRFIAELAQTMEFLHHEAKGSQQFYQIEFDLEQRAWHVGILKPEDASSNSIAFDPLNVGLMSLELADFLNPPLGNSQYFLPPPDFPSLGNLRSLPGEAYFEDIETPRGLITVESGVRPYIIFSPRGFTEFAVIHILRNNQSHSTLVTNPFTGEVEIHEGYREFRWELDEASGL